MMHANICMPLLLQCGSDNKNIPQNKCYRLNMSSDLISLHIGDRILEVNGTPVKDQPVENIENLIQYSDTVLQVSQNISKIYIVSLTLIQCN